MSDDVKLQVSLPAEVVETLRKQAVETNQTIGDVLRRSLANGQYLESVALNPDTELLIEEKGKFSKVTIAK